MTTERLILRRFTESDVDLLVALDSDPAVMHFITGGRPTPRDEIEHEVLPGVPRPTTSSSLATVSGRRSSGRAATSWAGSTFGRRRAVRADEPELGYRLKRSAWGQGYATEGARALIDRAFADLGARRVFATTMTINVASRRVMEKAGLRFVRTFFQDWPDRIPGDEQGDVEYALERGQWLEDNMRRPALD